MEAAFEDALTDNVPVHGLHNIGAGRLRRRHADDVEPGANPRGEEFDEMVKPFMGAEKATKGK